MSAAIFWLSLESVVPLLIPLHWILVSLQLVIKSIVITIFNVWESNVYFTETFWNSVNTNWITWTMHACRNIENYPATCICCFFNWFFKTRFSFKTMSKKLQIIQFALAAIGVIGITVSIVSNDLVGIIESIVIIFMAVLAGFLGSYARKKQGLK